MPKTCNYVNCTYPVFGGGFCRLHQRSRTDKKVKTSIRKVGANGKQRKKITQRTKLEKQDRLLYAAIWEERSHIDFETGFLLQEAPSTLNFHHVLPKAMYRQFRYFKWNIIIVSRETHDRYHRNPDLCPKIKEYHERLLNQIR